MTTRDPPAAGADGPRLWSHPRADIAHRHHQLGQSHAVVAFMTLEDMKLLTTGSHDDMRCLAGRLNAAREGRGPVYLCRTIALALASPPVAERADHPCSCGSGLERRELHDARGIFCAFVCDACEDDKRAGYRPEVLTNPNYSHDEPLEDD